MEYISTTRNHGQRERLHSIGGRRGISGAMAVGLVAVSGCVSVDTTERAVGSVGAVQTEERSVGDFTRIVVTGPFDVSVDVGGATSLAVTTEQHLISRVMTTVVDDSLELRLQDGPDVGSTAGLRVAVSTPALAGLSATDAAQVSLQSVDGRALDISASQASRVEASGSSDALTLELTSASSARFAGLDLLQATVRLDGASSAELSVQDLVSGEAHDASTVVLLGRPATVSVETTEASSVIER